MVKKEKLLCSVCAFLVAVTLTGCQKEPTTPLESPPAEIARTESGSSALADKTQDALPEQSSPEEPLQQPEADNPNDEVKPMSTMKVSIGEITFTATLESNAAVDAFVQMMHEEPVVIEMSDYAGFEKVGSLGTSLPTSNRQTTTQAGDIVLYQGNQIVIFYGSNSWSYTRLGKIDDLTGWEEALGNGDVSVTFTMGG